MAYKYSTQINERMSKAVGISLPISRKKSVEVNNWLRGKQLGKAKNFLLEVIKEKIPVPFKVYNRNIGHRPGMAAGRYPVKTCQHILAIINSAESNAQNKGLSSANLIVKHISAQKAPQAFRNGRKKTKAKRTHIEVVLEEVKNVGDKK